MKKRLCYGTYVKIDGLNIEFTTLVQVRDWDESGEREEATERYTPLFRMTVNHSTGMYEAQYSGDEYGEVFEKLIIATFTPEYVLQDGCDMLREYLDGASGQLNKHPLYGQHTFFMDLDEVHDRQGNYFDPNDWLNQEQPH